MIMKLNINDRAALAIKNNTKRVEIRANKENSEHDYSKLIENDMVYINVGSISIPKENNISTYMMYENRKFTIYDIEGNIFDSIEI